MTGGAGFIGSHLVRRLAGLGSDTISLGGNRDEGELAEGARYIFGDLSRDTLETVDFVPETVFHLAGGASVSASLANPPEDFLKSVFSSVVLLEFLRKNWPEARLIFISSAAIYGEAKEKKAHHDLACLPVSPYGVHKKQVESLLLDHARMYRTKSVIVRPFSVYGPGLRKQLLWDAMEKASRGVFEFAGFGDEQRDWVYVDDLVECLLQINKYASADVPVVNAGTCHGISVREVLTELFRVAGIRQAPVFVGNTREGDPGRLVANDSAEALLGPLFVTKLCDGLTAYVQWYNAERHR
ncbi:MAG: NAD-dependent epimerase/dehydratase family protein [Terracidiphilus sp.]